MVKLSRNEKKLYSHLEEHRGEKVCIVDLICVLYGPEPGKVIKFPVGSVNAQMRSLRLKCEVLGLPVPQRVSRLGTKSPAVYELRG